MPADRRARLFAVATEEFATFGFSQASLNRIIGKVGMSKSSFYHYFGNKTDLFKQTLDQALAPLTTAREAFDLEFLSAETFWPIMRQMMREMTEMLNQSPEMVMVGRMFYRSYDNPDEQEMTRDVMNQASDWLGDLMARGQDLGRLRKDLPQEFLIEMLMALGMAMDRWILGHWEDLSDGERLELNDQGFDLFLRMLEPR